MNDNNKTIKINMEQNKENVQNQPKKTGILKKIGAVIGYAVLGAATFAFATNFKGCRTATVNFAKGIKFPWSKTEETQEELPQTKPAQVAEYEAEGMEVEYRKPNFNNNRNGYQYQNRNRNYRRSQWNNN